MCYNVNLISAQRYSKCSFPTGKCTRIFGPPSFVFLFYCDFLKNTPRTNKVTRVKCILYFPLDFQVSQVVSLIHSDVHEESTMRMVNHISSTVITVSPSVRMSSDRELTGVCDIMHKRPSGKVLRKVRCFSQIQWNLVITRTSGPWKSPCYIRCLVISG